MRPMKRCATWFEPARRRPTTCAASGSNCCRSCCDTAASSTAAATGRWRIDAGLPARNFEHPAQQVVFQDAMHAIEDAAARLRSLEQQLAIIVPNWSMAPVVTAYQAMRGASFLVAVTFAA